MTYLEAILPERSDLLVIAKPWLLYRREFPKEVLVPPHCFAGLKRGKDGSAVARALDDSVIHGAKDLLPLKPYTSRLKTELVFVLSS